MDVTYDLTGARLHDSPNPYHRFRDLLPVVDAGLLPAETCFTPLVHAERLGAALGLERLYLKHEGMLPTGTTKARMAAVALAWLHERGVRAFCTSSTGNSSTAFAQAIGRFPDMQLYLFTADAFRSRVDLAGTENVIQFVLRGATFVEAFEAAAAFAKRQHVIAERGFFNPGRREGLKLAFLEAVDQCGQAFDWYAQAVSSAMGVYGAYKGARELMAMGVIDRLPGLLCVQQASCAPMVSAWEAGSDVIRPCDRVLQPQGLAMAILRGDPSRAYPAIRPLVQASGGSFAAVGDSEIREARHALLDCEGLDVCFSSAAALAGVTQAARRGLLARNARILVNLTGSDREARPALEREVWLHRRGDAWVLDRREASPDFPGVDDPDGVVA